MLIIGICISLQMFGQNNSVPPQTIRDLRVIDSLFAMMVDPWEVQLNINYKTNKLKLVQLYKVKQGKDVNSRVFEMDSLEASTKLDSLTIKQYCIRTNAKFESIFTFLHLMVKNKFLSLYPAGPGDCKACCVAIYFEKNKAYIVTNLKHYCMSFSNSCFWGLWDEDKCDYVYKEKNIDKITEDILIVKKISDL